MSFSIAAGALNASAKYGTDKESPLSHLGLAQGAQQEGRIL
jgi:hypothetical protein